jgi:hypothetical protein
MFEDGPRKLLMFNILWARITKDHSSDKEYLKKKNSRSIGSLCKTSLGTCVRAENSEYLGLLCRQDSWPSDKGPVLKANTG